MFTQPVVVFYFSSRAYNQIENQNDFLFQVGCERPWPNQWTNFPEGKISQIWGQVIEYGSESYNGFQAKEWKNRSKVLVAPEPDFMMIVLQGRDAQRED